MNKQLSGLGHFDGKTHVLPISIYYEDTDLSGVVYHANYLRYMERGRTEFFRLAGIYGPGRNQLETVRVGTAKRIDKPGQVFSRIHVDDIAAALRLSMAEPRPGAIYNLADDEPAPPQEVVAFAA